MLRPRTSDPCLWDASIFSPDVKPLPLDQSLRPTNPIAIMQAENDRHSVLFVAPATSRVHPELMRLAWPVLSERPDVGIFYGDDAVINPDGSLYQVYCKPSLDQTLLFADDYIGFPLFVRGSVFATVPFRSSRDSKADWYRFCLDAISAGISIDRIPHTLIASVAERPKAPRKFREKVIRHHIAAEALPCEIVPGLTADTSCMRRSYRNGYPSVTLVIPTRQSAPSDTDRPHILNFLESLPRSTWPLDKIQVLVGDDVEDDKIYRGLDDRLRLKRIITQRRRGEPFNYAAKMNLLWRQAESELIVLMNDDLVVRSQRWLEALFTHAMSTDVGGVGGRLLTPDGRIQHAGMVGGIYEVCAHPWYMKPRDSRTYCDWALVQRECSAVTGALFATRRSVLETINGFDEAFSLDFNDVDMCLRMRTLGYRVVYDPSVEMIHYEKASRHANFAPGDQVHLFMSRWEDFLTDDPSYSPQLRIDTDDITPLPAASRWL